MPAAPKNPQYTFDSPPPDETLIRTIPPHLERDVDRHLRRATRVTVENLVYGDGVDVTGTTKVWGVSLDPPSDDQVPALTADEIVRHCVYSAWEHLEGDTDVSPDFRLRIYLVAEKGKTPPTKYIRFSLKQETGDEAITRAREGFGEYERTEAHSLFEYQSRSFAMQQSQHAQATSVMMGQLSVVLQTILQANKSVLEEQRKMNEENRKALTESREQTTKAQDRLFRMALALTANNEHQDAMAQKSMEMFQTGWSWYMYSMHQQSLASERRHREEIERLRNQNREDNRGHWLKDLAPFAPAIMAFGGSLLSKMGVSAGDLLQAAAADAASESAPPEGFEVTPATESEPEMTEEQEHQIKQRIATMTLSERAARLGEKFTSAGWERLNAGMSPDQLRALQVLISAESDAQVLLAFRALAVQLEMYKPGDQVLDAVLDREQVLLGMSIAMECMGNQREVVEVDVPRPPAPPRPANPSPPVPAGAVRAVPDGFGPPVLDLEAAPDEDSLPSAEDADAKLALREMLESVKGLGSGTLNALLEFGSINALSAMTDAELRAVRGVGPAIVKGIRSAIKVKLRG